MMGLYLGGLMDETRDETKQVEHLSHIDEAKRAIVDGASWLIQAMEDWVIG